MPEEQRLFKLAITFKFLLILITRKSTVTVMFESGC